MTVRLAFVMALMAVTGAAAQQPATPRPTIAKFVDIYDQK
jgi:hypothetical protein